MEEQVSSQQSSWNFQTIFLAKTRKGENVLNTHQKLCGLELGVGDV